MALLKKNATLAQDADIHQEIINAAGKIYNYLSDKGEVTISKMKKDLDLYENFAEMGLGWLSREDKLEYTKNARSVSVKLR
ncbi:MAG: winged helix-turn-helix domain-containing protein [Cyanobacteria bacterium RUI128]|nr:winged helix-turn-helix domain-containing protein [Cyanobacteria bacterium RUI128]